MEEKTILKLALFVSLGGILLLYYLSSGIDFDAVKGIEEIPENQEIKVIGKLGRVVEKDEVAFLELWREKIEKIDIKKTGNFKFMAPLLWYKSFFTTYNKI